MTHVPGDRTTARRRLPRRALLMLATVLAPAAGWASWLALTGNVHTVIAGELYRSGQLPPDALAGLIEANGIRTVVNLKGARPGKPWYDDERRTTEAHGATLVDFDWRAQDEVAPDEVAAFIETVRAAEKPILVHCHAGADRTGLGVALYLAAVAGADEETAESALSLVYGHVGLPFTQAWPMDRTFEREEPALGFFES